MTKLANVVMVYVCMFGMVVGSIFYTNHVQHQTEAKFCSVVNLVVDAYTSLPPSTDLGRELLNDYTLL